MLRTHGPAIAGSLWASTDELLEGPAEIIRMFVAEGVRDLFDREPVRVQQLLRPCHL